MAKSGEKKVSQRSMVQVALERCGWNAKPNEMQVYIKDTFNVELAPNIISNYKSQIKRQGVAQSEPQQQNGGGSLEVGDVKAVAHLVKKLGAEKVKEIVDVIG